MLPVDATGLHMPRVTKQDIIALQLAMREYATPVPEPQHFFWPGKYARVLTVPKDMLVVGKTHRHAHVLLVLSGFAEVVGDGARRLVVGGDAYVSPAGAKRAVYAFEDTTFMTIHDNPTDTQDLVQIEADHIEPEALEPPATPGALT